MEPEEVLELIGSASRRYGTVRADGPKRKEIRERIVRTEAGRRAFRISPREASEAISRPADYPEPDGPYGWRSLTWRADKYHWRVETGVPGGGVDILACNGRRRLPIGGPPGSGVVWDRRVDAGPREGDPRWFRLAGDHYWTFYPLLTDEISGISGELRPLDLTVEGTLTWAGREAVLLRACRARGGPGNRTPTP